MSESINTPKTAKPWEPCTPLGKHPELQEHVDIRQGIVFELVCQLLARGATHAEVAHILEPSSSRSPEAASMWLSRRMLDKHNGHPRARITHIVGRLGVPVEMQGGEFSRKSLIEGLVGRMKIVKADRDYAQLASVLSRVCGFDQQALNLNVPDPLRQLSDALQERLKLCPPRPAQIPEHVRLLEEAQKARAAIDVTPPEN